jgi:hypothetical protein
MTQTPLFFDAGSRQDALVLGRPRNSLNPSQACQEQYRRGARADRQPSAGDSACPPHCSPSPTHAVLCGALVQTEYSAEEVAGIPLHQPPQLAALLDALG